MYWNGITDNQFAVLAGAVIAPDGFGACVKPAFPAVSCNAANPKGRAFAGKVFLHKQAVASLAAIERNAAALRNKPRLALKADVALLTSERKGRHPSQAILAAHALRSKSICGHLSCAVRVAEFMVVRRGILSKHKLSLASARAKACFVGAVQGLLIAASAFFALIGDTASLRKPATSATAKLRVSRLGRNSMEEPITLLADKFNFHSRIIPQFMGSGTTLRAAKDLGLKAIGIEIERKYCDIAIERLRQQAFSFEENL